MASFWNHFKKAPDGVERRGLGRWFQLLEERFMPMFWANLVTFLFLPPSLILFFFFIQSGDLRIGAGMLLCFILAGPGITALHYICIRVVHGMHVWMWPDYKACLKREWKKSLGLTAIVGFLWFFWLTAVLLVSQTNGGLDLLYLLFFLAYGYVLMGFTIFSYQQLSMVELPFTGVLKNGLFLIFASRGRGFFAIVLALAVLVLVIEYYYYAFVLLPLGLMAIMAMTVNLILAPIFERFFLKEEDEEDA